MLEVFNNLFMSIAEQMGSVLENTSYSVNMKERLDFSCALFDPAGDLIANAPHMPVHLGSMSESVKTVIRERVGTMNPGDVYVLNAPYNGGTHLPDVTVITPVFGEHETEKGRPILFYVGARGDHGLHRLAHRAEVHRHVRRVGDQVARRVEERARKIQPLFHVHRVGGVLQHRAHLLGDAHEKVVEHFQHHRVHLRPDRAAAVECYGALQHEVGL